MSLHSFLKRGCDGSQLPKVSKKDLYSYKNKYLYGKLGKFND